MTSGQERCFHFLKCVLENGGNVLDAAENVFTAEPESETVTTTSSAGCFSQMVPSGFIYFHLKVKQNEMGPTICSCRHMLYRHTFVYINTHFLFTASLVFGWKHV